MTLAYPGNSAGQPGQYSIGLFDASAATQSYLVAGNPTSPPSVNALQLRNVTNIGAWVGSGGGTWDAGTTANFASNLYSDALVTTTFDTAEATLGAVVFGDTYWNNGTAAAVTQTSVTIAAGGVSANTARFANSSLNYTLNSSDSIGLTNSSRLMKGGAGTLTMSGTNTYSGGTGIGGGVLEFGNGSLGTTGGIVVNGGTLRWTTGNTADISSRLVMESGGTSTLDTNGNSVTLASAIGNSTSSGLVKTGSGTLTLSAASTYTGTTTVAAGTLATVSLGTGALTVNSGAILSWTSATSANLNPTSILLDGGTLSLDGTNTFHNFISRPIELRAGTLTSANGAELMLNGGSSVVTVAGSGLSTISMSKLYAVNGASFNVGDTVSGSGTDLLISSAVINGQNGQGIIKNGAGTMELSSGSNTYNGLTQINAGRVALSGAGSIATSSGVDLAASGTAFSISAASGGRTIARLTGVAGSAVELGVNSLTVSNATSNTFSGSIGGTGGLIKTGSGTLAITGTNTYTGDTVVDAGTLTLANTSALQFLIGASVVNNSIVGSGTINLNGMFVFDLANASANVGDFWNIVGVGSLSESYGGTFGVSSTQGAFSESADVWSISENGVTYEFSEATGVLAVIPEPATALLGSIGLFMLMRRRRA